MILELGLFSIKGSNNLVNKKWPIWFVPSWASNPYFVVCLSGKAIIPALFSIISIFSYFDLNSLANWLTDSKSY